MCLKSRGFRGFYDEDIDLETEGNFWKLAFLQTLKNSN